MTRTGRDSLASEVAPACAVLDPRDASPARAQRVNGVEAQPGAPAQGACARAAVSRAIRRGGEATAQPRMTTQMQQLGQVNDRFERERMQLLRDERRARQALRAEVLAGDSADQKKVAGLLDELLTIQRRRLDLDGKRAARARDVHERRRSERSISAFRMSFANASRTFVGSARSGGQGRTRRTASAAVGSRSARLTAHRVERRLRAPLHCVGVARPGGGIGRRRGLKIPRPSGLTSSSLVPGMEGLIAFREPSVAHASRAPPRVRLAPAVFV